jgi:Reverse transcriptase (RNA-dependent DNA polymerase)
LANWKREEPVDEAKPFKIPKREVWEAFKRVKANQGAAGVDGQSIAEFEAKLSGNLYKLWNRLSSGSYFPPPVRRVEIPKANGGTRPLGVPTVADRIAQEVARRYLEPIVEPVFQPDSYGYRPGKSAIDGVRTARERCWRYDWVLDLDIKGFFDSIDWELMRKAVRQHTDCPWVLLYIERWLKAPVQMEDGSVVPRTGGTPQGGDLASVGEPIPALRIRRVDGAEVSAYPVREVRGRHHLSLQERRGGAGTLGRNGLVSALFADGFFDKKAEGVSETGQIWNEILSRNGGYEFVINMEFGSSMTSFNKPRNIFSILLVLIGVLEYLYLPTIYLLISVIVFFLLYLVPLPESGEKRAIHELSAISWPRRLPMNSAASMRSQRPQRPN